MRRLKTVRRPPIYPKTPGHLPCSSLTHPLPLSSRRPSVSFGGFGLSWIADYPDPENFLDGLFHTNSSNNQTGYSNPDVDRLLEQARVETDESARYELYHRAENLILEDAPWVLLWHGGIEYVLVKPYVKGYLPTSMTVPVLRHVSMTEK